MTAKVHDFHDGNLHFQERFGTVKLAERGWRSARRSG